MATLSISKNILNQKVTLSLTTKRLKKVNQLTVFNYHQTGVRFDKSRFSKSTFTQLKFFDKQMAYIKKHFNVVPLMEAIELANNDQLTGNVASITFDDGDKSIADSMRVLEKHNLPATFFVNSGYLANQGAYWFNIYNFIKHSTKYSHLLTEEINSIFPRLRKTLNIDEYQTGIKLIEPLFSEINSDFDMYVDLEFLKSINTDLFDIGSHGFEHQRFSMMPKEWQQKNIEKDIAILSSLPSYQPIFAIPFGRPHDWNFDTIDVIRELDMEFVYADGGISTGKSVGYQRIPADRKKIKKLI